VAVVGRRRAGRCRRRRDRPAGADRYPVHGHCGGAAPVRAVEGERGSGPPRTGRAGCPAVSARVRAFAAHLAPGDPAGSGSGGAGRSCGGGAGGAQARRVPGETAGLAQPGVGDRPRPGAGAGRCGGDHAPAVDHVVHRLRDERDHRGGGDTGVSVTGVGAGRAALRGPARGPLRAVRRPAGEGPGGPRQGFPVQDGDRRIRSPGRGRGGPARLHPPPQRHGGGPEPGGGADVPGRAARLRPPAAPRQTPHPPQGRSPAGLRGLHRPAAGLGAVVEHLPPVGAAGRQDPASGLAGRSDPAAGQSRPRTCGPSPWRTPAPARSPRAGSASANATTPRRG
jgi:hypothetical protein